MNKRRLRLLHLLRLVIHQKYIRLLYITLGVFLLLCTCSANSGESNAMAKQQKDSILIERFWDTYDFTDTILDNLYQLGRIIIQIHHIPCFLGSLCTAIHGNPHISLGKRPKESRPKPTCPRGHTKCKTRPNADNVLAGCHWHQSL